MRFVLNMKELIENKIHIGNKMDLNSVFFYLKHSIFLSETKNSSSEYEDFFYIEYDCFAINEKKVIINKFEDVECFYNVLACRLTDGDSQFDTEKIVIELNIKDVNEKFKAFKLLSLIIILFKICLHLNNYHSFNYREVTQKCLDLKSLLILSNKKYSIFQNFKGMFPNKNLSSCPNFLFDRKNKKIQLMIKEIKIEKLLKKEKVLMPHLDIISELLNNDFLLNEMKEKASLDIVKNIFNDEKLESFVKNENYIIEKINNIEGLFVLNEAEKRFCFFISDFYVGNEIKLNEVNYQDVSIKFIHKNKENELKNEHVKLVFNTVTNELSFNENIKNIKVYALNKKEIDVLRKKYEDYQEMKNGIFPLINLFNIN